MTTLRVGLIGFGAWTKMAYLPALQFDGRGIVTAVAASSEKTRLSVHEVLKSKVTVFDNYEALLKESEIDVVMIAVPDRLHQEILSAALQRGIPVFYEPPLADTRQQIPLMIDCLLAARQVTHADLELGLNPVIAHAAGLIQSNRIGLLQNITIELKAAWGRELPGLDLCLINRSTTWYVDILNRMIGSIPQRVLVLDGYGTCGRRQTTSTGIFDYNGIWGLLKINVNSAEKLSIMIEMNGDEGEIKINLLTGELYLRTLQNPNWTIESWPALKPYADWPGVRESIMTFFDAVIDGKSTPCNAKTVAQLHLIGLAADESKDSGTWVEIKKLS